MGSSCKSITRLLSQLPEEEEEIKYIYRDTLSTEIKYIYSYYIYYCIYYIVIQRERGPSTDVIRLVSVCMLSHV